MALLFFIFFIFTDLTCIIAGYPSDPVTNEYLKSLMATPKAQWPDFVRKSWKLKLDSMGSGAAIKSEEDISD